MLVECIKGQGEEKKAVLGVALCPETDEEIKMLALLVDDGAFVWKTDGSPYITITPRSPVEEESEEKPAEETTLETGRFLG